MNKKILLTIASFFLISSCSTAEKNSTNTSFENSSFIQCFYRKGFVEEQEKGRYVVSDLSNPSLEIQEGILRLRDMLFSLDEEPEPPSAGDEFIQDFRFRINSKTDKAKFQVIVWKTQNNQFLFFDEKMDDDMGCWYKYTSPENPEPELLEKLLSWVAEAKTFTSDDDLTWGSSD